MPDDIKAVSKNSPQSPLKTPEPFIPVCEPSFIGNEEQYTQEAVKTTWVSSSGRFIDAFESSFAAYLGASHAITVSNGTAALHLALLALGVEEGDEVIIPDFTMVAVLLAVLYCKAKPVFVDVDADTWCMSIKEVQKKITPRTKIIIPVHTYGHPVDMEPLLSLAKTHRIAILEDAAEAHGAEYQNTKCGNIGTIAAFSFFGNKIITTGEGGMVVTSDDELAQRCRYFKNLCFPIEGERDYVHHDLGYNYRMTNMQAALGLAQLECIDQHVFERRNNARRYNERLTSIPGIRCPIEQANTKNVYWMYGILIDEQKFGCSRDVLKQQLRESGIDTRYFFRPLHNQPLLAKLGIEDQDGYPVSKDLSERGLYLPSSSRLTDEMITRICDAIETIHQDSRRA